MAAWAGARGCSTRVPERCERRCLLWRGHGLGHGCSSENGRSWADQRCVDNALAGQEGRHGCGAPLGMAARMRCDTLRRRGGAEGQFSALLAGAVISIFVTAAYSASVSTARSPVASLCNPRTLCLWPRIAHPSLWRQLAALRHLRFQVGGTTWNGRSNWRGWWSYHTAPAVRSGAPSTIRACPWPSSCRPAPGGSQAGRSHSTGGGLADAGH